jgi:hypothetical protein
VVGPVILAAHPTVAAKAPVFATTDLADTFLFTSYTPSIGNPPFPYTAFMYANDAGAVVLEYTANMEYALIGNTNAVLEKALVLPLNTMVPPDHVPEPVTLLEFPDLSFHTVTALAEFMLLLSAPSSHNVHPGIDTGENPKMLLDVPSIVFLEQNIPKN